MLNSMSRARVRNNGSAGEALVDVLVDDVRLVQDEVALDQHRQAVVRVHHRDVLGLVVQVDVDDLEIHALLVEHEAAAVAEGAGGARIKLHHIYFTSFQNSFLSR
jgi:hypothetical protein